jgi:hypothetical protein
MIRAAAQLARPGRRHSGQGFRLVSLVPTVLGHGSGVDDLVIFLLPAVLGIGFWLITRHKPDQDQDDEGGNDTSERD